MPGSMLDLLVASEGLRSRGNMAGLSRLEGLEGSALLSKGVADVEGVVVGAGEQLGGVVAPASLKLVEDGVVLVEVAELVEEVVVELDDSDGSSLISDVPDLHGEVVTRDHHAAARRELDVTDSGDQLLEEASNFAVLIFERFGLLLAQGGASQVSHTDDTLAARVNELVAVGRVQISAGDDLGKFVHVVGLDVNGGEGLVLDTYVPKVDSQVVRGDEGLSVRVEGNTVDVVRVASFKNELRFHNHVSSARVSRSYGSLSHLEHLDGLVYRGRGASRRSVRGQLKKELNDRKFEIEPLLKHRTSS